MIFIKLILRLLAFPVGTLLTIPCAIQFFINGRNLGYDLIIWSISGKWP